MTTYLSSIGSFFAEEKKEVFSLMSVGAEIVEIASLSAGSRGAAQKIADFSKNAKDLFAWPDLVETVKTLLDRIQDFYNDAVADKISQLCVDVLNVGGALCDVLESVHNHLKLIDLGKALFWIKQISYISYAVDVIHEAYRDFVENEGGLDSRRMFVIAKAVAAVAITALSVYSLWIGVTVFPVATTICTAVLLASKIALHHFERAGASEESDDFHTVSSDDGVTAL